ncbi:MAG: trigger factor [Alphaproteobacteria bacterium]|jgi:trigger factor|nr:trigger factor [Alphaproteobacteria bacterium]
MEFTALTTEGLKKTFKVKIPKNHLELCLNERLQKIGETAKIPGFRPGKAPLPILKQRYGTSVQGEVIEKAIQDGVGALIKEHQLKIALRPDVKIENYEEQGDLSLDVSVEILPEITAPTLEKLSYEKLRCLVPEEELTKALDQLRGNNAITEEVKKARAAKKGDVAVIDFEGFLNGVAFAGGKASGTKLELGSGTFIPGFEEQIEGHKPGESFDITVTFPADYPSKDLAGQETIFKINLLEIHTKVLPELNDAFAKQIGFESLDALKEAARTQISADRERMSFLVAKRAVLDDLASKFSFEVPEGLVKAEFESIWQQYESRAASAANDEGAEEEKPTPEEMEKDKAQYKEIAVRRVRLGLVLAEVGRQYEVGVTQRELERAIMETARAYPGRERDIVEYFRSNEAAQASLRAPIFEDKVVQLILDKANITHKDLPLEELVAAFKNVTEGEEDLQEATS